MVSVSVERDDIVPILLLVGLLGVTYMTWSRTNELIQLFATRTTIISPWVFLLLIGGYGISAFVMSVFSGPLVEGRRFTIASLVLVLGIIIGFFIWLQLQTPLDALNQLPYSFTNYIPSSADDYMLLMFINYVNDVAMWIAIWFISMVGFATAAIATTD